MKLLHFKSIGVATRPLGKVTNMDTTTEISFFRLRINDVKLETLRAVFREHMSQYPYSTFSPITGEEEKI